MQRQSINFESINSAALSCAKTLLERWLPAGRIVGAEYEVGDLNGNKGSSLKINMRTGKWSDFESGESGGDLISLYAAIHKIDQIEAAKQVAELVGVNIDDIGNNVSSASNTGNKKPKWEPVHPVPDTAPQFDFRHYKHGVPAMVWHYTNAEGKLLGVIARYNIRDGKKEVIPWTWCRSDRGQEKWHTLSFSKPRPLYGLQELADNPSKQVIIVEGEKAREAAHRLMAGAAVVITWPGGGKAIKHVDLSPLKGRAVAIWPDADSAGMNTAEGWVDDYGTFKEGLAQLLEGQAEKVRIIEPPEGVAEGWDLADAEAEGWDRAKVIAYIKEHAREAKRYEKPEPLLNNHEYDDYGEPCLDAPEQIEETFFRALGHNKGTYYFMSHRSHQIYEFSSQALTSAGALIELAPQHYWEREYGNFDAKGRLSAANALVQHCFRLGVFRPEMMRGRGAWWDDGSTVVHVGDCLIVDGKDRDIDKHKSRFVYEAARPICASIKDPLSPQEACRFKDLCESLFWQKPVYATLLSGWCVIAPVCGALSWRPHIWITSPSGGGKSWVLSKIIRPTLGEMALSVQSHTSEAGIRQVLGHDARPVVFDESESNDAREAQRIENVLALMRTASSDGEGKIYKGTTSGKAMSYDIRSSFVMASINVNIKQRADTSRITVLELLKDNSPEAMDHFRDVIKPLAAEIMTEEWCLRLQARTMKYIPVLRRNAQLFGEAAAEHLKDSRIGDQIGALLAGAYLLHSNKEVSLEFAREWVRKQDWGDQEEIINETDELSFIDYLCQHIIRIQASTRVIEKNIEELLLIADGRGDANEVISRQEASQTLTRHGLKVERIDGKSYVTISNTHKELSKILRESRWHTKWNGVLKRIDGAFSSQDKKSFKGKQSRAVHVPIELFVEDGGKKLI